MERINNQTKWQTETNRHGIIDMDGSCWFFFFFCHVKLNVEVLLAKVKTVCILFVIGISCVIIYFIHPLSPSQYLTGRKAMSRELIYTEAGI